MKTVKGRVSASARTHQHDHHAVSLAAWRAHPDFDDSANLVPRWELRTGVETWPDPTSEFILNDSSLEGWEQTTKVMLQPGTKVRVLRICHHRSGGLFDFAEFATAWIETLDACATNWEAFPLPIFFEKPDASKRRSLDELAAAFVSITGFPVPKIYAPYDLKGEPAWNWPQFESASDQSIFDGLVAIRQFIDEEATQDEARGGRLLNMLDNAYSIGRSAREAELKAEFEKMTIKEHRRKRPIGQAGGKATGQINRDLTAPYHKALSIWAQALIASASGPRPVTYSRLADLIRDHWHEKPFSFGPSEPPGHEYMIKKLLPPWRLDRALRS